jgi:hypothetical protein
MAITGGRHCGAIRYEAEGETLTHALCHCADCGTVLFYMNANILPGIVDAQSVTYDDPHLVPARAHVQTAERIGWMALAHELPTFERLPAAVGASTR